MLRFLKAILAKNFLFENTFAIFIICLLFHKTYFIFKFLPYEKEFFITCSSFLAIYIVLFYIKETRAYCISFDKKLDIRLSSYFINLIFSKDRKNNDEIEKFLFFLSLYVLFIAYCFLTSYFHGPFISTNIMLLFFLSYPICSMLGIFCSKYKKASILTTYVLSFLYFAFFAKKLLFGEISRTHSNFQGVFIPFNHIMNDYQNVNYYLGLFSVLSSSFLFYEPNFLMIQIKNIIKKFSWFICLQHNINNKKYFKIKQFLLIFNYIFFASSLILSLFFMSIVAARANVVAVLTIILMQFFFYVKNLYFNKKYFSLSLYACSFLFACAVFLFITYDMLIFTRIINAFDRSSQSSLRLELFSQGLKLFSTSPIWGSGLGSFPAFIGKGMVLWGEDGALTNHPHNWILELLSAVGIFGVSIFCMSFYYIIQKSIKYFEMDFYAKTTLFLTMYCFINSLFVGSLINLNILIFFLFLFLYNNVSKKSREPS